MSNKKYMSLLVLGLTSMCLTAAPRNVQQARAIASRVMTERMHLGATVMAEPMMQAPLSTLDQTEQPVLTPYYLFTDTRQQAFVFVSGSDLMPEVLGYGTSLVPPSAEALPQPLQGWLQYVAEIESYVEEHPESAALLQHATASTTPIPQMMTTTWGQDDPYYNECPLKNGRQTVTGCMATSISQVLNYNRYPEQFSGSYSYDDNGVKRSIDLSAVSIDYDLLLDSYNRYSGEAECAEVAKLMYTVGICLNMSYGTKTEGGSGAITEMGWRGLVKSLGQDKVQNLMRKYYTLDEWNEILQYELQNNRPVVMNGHSSEGGHSFVVDGLDDKGYYHVNWGWDGLANGYFDVSVLHPDEVGTGASDAADGFNRSQDIYVNIGNPEQISRWYCPVIVNQGSMIKCQNQSTTLGKDISFTASIYNSAPVGFKGYIGMLVMQGDEVYMQEENKTLVSLGATTLYSSKGKYYYSSWDPRDIRRTINLPADMPEGEYQIYMYARPDTTEQYDFIRQVQNRPNYWTANVTGDHVTLTNTQASLPIRVDKWSMDTEQMLTQPSTVKVEFYNDSRSSVACALYASLKRPDGKIIEDIPAKDVLTLAPEATAEAEFDVDLSLDGEWEIELMGQPIGIDIDYLMPISSRTFTVDPHPTLGARFTVSKKLEVTSGTVYNVGPVDFNIQLKNDGAAYHGQMAVRLYSSKTSTAAKYLQAEIINDVDFPSLETQDVAISGQLNLSSMAVPHTTLYARIFYLAGDAMEPLSTAVTNVSVTRKEEEGIQAVTMDEDSSNDFSHAEVYDICGRRINVTGALPRGIYIVNGQKKIVK